jgi:hypothetical protein
MTSSARASSSGDTASQLFGGLQVDDQLEPGRLPHWKIGRAGAFEYLVNLAGGTPIHVSNICPVRHEPAGQRKFFNAMKRRLLVGYCATRNAPLIAKGERVFDR